MCLDHPNHQPATRPMAQHLLTPAGLLLKVEVTFATGAINNPPILAMV